MDLIVPNRFDVVGSFLRSEPLRKARNDYYYHQINKEQLTNIENREISLLIKKQLNAGLINITDGEYRRTWWHLDFFHGLNGVEEAFSQAAQDEIKKEKSNPFIGRSDEVRLSERISGENHPFVNHFVFTDTQVKEQTDSDKVLTRQSAPSPSRFYYQLISSPNQLASLKAIYATKTELFKDITAAYRTYVKELYTVGCRNIQFDDTTWITLEDNERFNKIFHFYNGDKESLKKELAEDYVYLNNEVIKDQPIDIIFSTHTCRGNFRSMWASKGGYENVASHIFEKQLFDAYFLEYDTDRAGGFEPLAVVPEDKFIVLGLVTSKTPELENPEMIKERIKEASQYHPLEKLCLSPQCGFASTEEGNKLTEDEQWNKVQLIKNIAVDVWDDTIII